jgi:hypothetical protein
MQDVGKLLMGLGSQGSDKKSSASIACFLGQSQNSGFWNAFVAKRRMWYETVVSIVDPDSRSSECRIHAKKNFKIILDFCIIFLQSHLSRKAKLAPQKVVDASVLISIILLPDFPRLINFGFEQTAPRQFCGIVL